MTVAALHRREAGSDFETSVFRFLFFVTVNFGPVRSFPPVKDRGRKIKTSGTVGQRTGQWVP